ncbi:MAG: MjaI family restriction endonuclease [Bacteroidota bacterium]
MNKDWIYGSDGHNLKFKRETLLNYGMNRWGLNKARSVGPTSEMIRLCAPKTFEEWENYYFKNAKQKKKNGIKITRNYLTGLGQTLYIKLSEVVQKELDLISEEECIDYAYNLVLNRTYEGYKSEVDTIYGQLESIIKYKIEVAPDEWDRTYGVDFFVCINGGYLGLQIKPISSGQSLNQYQWDEMHRKHHEKFKEDFGGRVFFIYSIKGSGKKKIIYNTEVIDEILKEIKRLSSN